MIGSINGLSNIRGQAITEMIIVNKIWYKKLDSHEQTSMKFQSIYEIFL